MREDILYLRLSTEEIAMIERIMHGEGMEKRSEAIRFAIREAARRYQELAGAVPTEAGQSLDKRM